MRCVRKRHADDNADTRTDSSYMILQRPCQHLSKYCLAHLRSFCNKTSIVSVPPSPHPPIPPSMTLPRIHSRRASNPRSNTVVANHLCPGRIRPAVTHLCLLATEGEHSGSRKTVARILGAGCTRDGESGPARASFRDITAEIGAEQDERRVGV